MGAPRSSRAHQALFIAEQNRLLVRVAADTGARRGEIAALRMLDLTDFVLTRSSWTTGCVACTPPLV